MKWNAIQPQTGMKYIYSTTWINLKCILLGERNHTKKGSIPHDSIYKAFWKEQNYRDKKISVATRV